MRVGPPDAHDRPDYFICSSDLKEKSLYPILDSFQRKVHVLGLAKSKVLQIKPTL